MGNGWSMTEPEICATLYADACGFPRLPVDYLMWMLLAEDWRFIEFASGHTDVRLVMYFQACASSAATSKEHAFGSRNWKARNFFFLPLWDTMQASFQQEALESG